MMDGLICVPSRFQPDGPQSVNPVFRAIILLGPVSFAAIGVAFMLGTLGDPV